MLLGIDSEHTQPNQYIKGVSPFQSRYNEGPGDSPGIQWDPQNNVLLSRWPGPKFVQLSATRALFAFIHSSTIALNWSVV